MCAVHRAIYVHHPSSLSTYEFEIFKSRWHTSSSLLWRHGRTNYLSIDFPICVDQNARPTRRALRSHTHRHICSWVCLQNKSIRTETTPQNNNNKQKNNGLMCNPRMALMLVPAHLMYIKWTHSDVMAYTQAFTHALHCVRRTVHLCYDNLSVAHSLTYSHTHMPNKRTIEDWEGHFIIDKNAYETHIHNAHTNPVPQHNHTWAHTIAVGKKTYKTLIGHTSFPRRTLTIVRVASVILKHCVR